MKTETVRISAMDLIRRFIEFGMNKGKRSFPPLYTGTQPWHELLYDLKRNHMVRFPELACIGNFDWDGPFPRASIWRDIQLGCSLALKYDIDLGSGRILPDLKFVSQMNLKIPEIDLELLETMFQVAENTDFFFED